MREGNSQASAGSASWSLGSGAWLLGICFHARRTGDGQNGERPRGVRSTGPHGGSPDRRLLHTEFVPASAGRSSAFPPPAVNALLHICTDCPLSSGRANNPGILDRGVTGLTGMSQRLSGAVRGGRRPCATASSIFDWGLLGQLVRRPTFFCKELAFAPAVPETVRTGRASGSEGSDGTLLQTRPVARSRRIGKHFQPSVNSDFPDDAPDPLPRSLSDFPNPARFA